MELTREANSNLRHFVIMLIAVLAFLAISNAFLAFSRGDEQVQSNLFRAYLGLRDVYKRGGQAPELVARLNAAVELTEEAKIKTENGDAVGAASLNNQAEADIASILSEIPAAQQNADRVSATRTITVAALAPVSVTVSTFAFYLMLRVRRMYERRQLYEMRIVEKTTQD